MIMLENSDFNNDIKFINNLNKKNCIKNSKIYSVEYNKSITRMKTILTKNKIIKKYFILMISQYFLLIKKIL
jgi:hypothetical protein